MVGKKACMDCVWTDWNWHKYQLLNVQHQHECNQSPINATDKKMKSMSHNPVLLCQQIMGTAPRLVLPLFSRHRLTKSDLLCAHSHTYVADNAE